MVGFSRAPLPARPAAGRLRAPCRPGVTPAHRRTPSARSSVMPPWPPPHRTPVPSSRRGRHSARAAAGGIRLVASRAAAQLWRHQQPHTGLLQPICGPHALASGRTSPVARQSRQRRPPGPKTARKTSRRARRPPRTRERPRALSQPPRRRRRRPAASRDSPQPPRMPAHTKSAPHRSYLGPVRGADTPLRYTHVPLCVADAAACLAPPCRPGEGGTRACGGTPSRAPAPSTRPSFLCSCGHLHLPCGYASRSVRRRHK